MLAHQIQINQAVFGGKEDLLASVSPLGYVVCNTGHDNSRRT